MGIILSPCCKTDSPLISSTLTKIPQFHTIPVKIGQIFVVITMAIEKTAKLRGMMEEKGRNSLKTYRKQVFISKAELARKAGISPATVDRIEKGKGCHRETRRKIILALGLEQSEGEKLLGEDQ